MAGVELIREGRLEPKKAKATLREKPAKATNIKLGPGWADVMPVEPGGVWGNSDAKPAMKQEAPHSMRGGVTCACGRRMESEASHSLLSWQH